MLNKLHAVYEAEQQYHSDSVAKLQNFIKNSGGVDGLVGYGSVTDDGVDDADDETDDEFSDDTDSDPKRAVQTAWSVEQMQAQLYDSAKDFYGSVSTPVSVELLHTLPLTVDGMGVVLVRRHEAGYQLIGASNDDTIVRPLAMQTYLNDFCALPQSVRPIVELVSTQCLPLRLQLAYESLVDPAAKSAGKGKRRSVRRVMYRHQVGEFILSPIHADSGVVTVARPSAPVLANASRDAYLSTRGRRALERRLVSGRDFNMYVPADPMHVPEYLRPDLASHAIRLQNRFAEREYLHLDFWPFYGILPEPRGQLVVRDLIAAAGTWQASISLAWFRKFALEFTMPWVQTHGTHIKRGHQQILQLQFDVTALTVHFVYREGVFEVEQAIDMQGVAVAGTGITVRALTKDFIVAMQAIADLRVVSAVLMNVDAHVMSLAFSTSAAAYRLYIPTCNLKGERSTAAFAHYEPVPFESDHAEQFDDQQEGDFDEARSV